MRGQRRQPEIGAGQKGSAARLCLVAVAVAVLGSGCGAAAAGTAAVNASPAGQYPNSPSVTAASDQSEADAFALRIAEALDSLVAQTPEPDAEGLRAVFVRAGAEAASVEVSVDITPTGLEVDAMTAASPVGETCVFGHLRDGTVTVAQLPVLADGRCFVGDQR